MKKWRKTAAAEVREWFSLYSVGMTIADGVDDDQTTTFTSADGTTSIRVTVDYKESCPTCGGAYVKKWEVTP